MWWRRLRWLIGLIAISALATCPLGWRACKRDARAREAERLLGYLAAQAGSLYATTHALPRAGAGPTPPLGACCKHGGQCGVDTTQWDAPTWRALKFTIDDPHRFSYAYEPTPDGGAVLRAVGDVDCDGKPAVIELRLAPAPDATHLTEVWTRQDETE